MSNPTEAMVWQCGKCRQYYINKKDAEECCKERMCERCGKILDNTRPYTVCPECMERNKYTNQNTVYEIAKDRKELDKNARFYVYYYEYRDLCTITCNNEDDLYQTICKRSVESSQFFYVLDLVEKEIFTLYSEDVWSHCSILKKNKK